MDFVLFKKALSSAIKSISLNAILGTTHDELIRLSLWFQKRPSLLISLLFLQLLLLSLLSSLLASRRLYMMPSLPKHFSTLLFLAIFYSFFDTVQVAPHPETFGCISHGSTTALSIQTILPTSLNSFTSGTMTSRYPVQDWDGTHFKDYLA